LLSVAIDGADAQPAARCRRAARTPEGRCSGGRHDDHAAIERAVDRRIEVRIVPEDRRIGPQGEIEDVGAVRHRQSIPAMTSSVEPEPVDAEHADDQHLRAGRHALDADPLSVLAATMPATWVP
jgi:hypothetical protein